MITHIIYHISGRKVGCTNDLIIRKEWYLKSEGLIPEIEILEELHDKTDQEAGDREWEWADWFGYRRDGHYLAAVKAALKFGEKGAVWRAKNQTPERRSEISRMGGLGWSKNRTHEQKIEFASMGGRRINELGVSGFKKRGICPHCGFESNLAVLGRCHGDRCKNRKMRGGN